MMNDRFVLILGLSAFLQVGLLQSGTSSGLPLLPWPRSVTTEPGHFPLTPTTRLIAAPAAEETARFLAGLLEYRTGLRLQINNQSTAGPAIILTLDSGLQRLGPEGYRLEVRPDSVHLSAPESTGLFYGFQTLLQLVPGKPPSNGPSAGSSESLPPQGIPAITIEDWPRFAWRGLMLDCSRTFQSLEYLRSTIDRMALLKLNVLHLHLTDDQGWRVEIRRFPELTQTGARFAKRFNEPAANQGYYSQKDLRELVQYAGMRGITIVPEIEMPGHSLAVLSCFPELSCSGNQFEIFPFFKGPNITEDLLCAGNSKTFEFLEQVLAEVVSVFPSQFIHIGGDEAPKTKWKACPKCQERIRREGLRDEEELQSYFIRRAQDLLRNHGRSLIGWTEIVDGGLAPGAAVMNWLGMRGAEAAARSGQPIVMSPTSHCYFDYDYKAIDSRLVYSYEPVPETFEAGQEKLILGIQANFWSHIDRTPEKVDAQLFPRLLPLAERGWSDGKVRDWDAFLPRLRARMAELEAAGVISYPDPSVGR